MSTRNLVLAGIAALLLAGAGLPTMAQAPAPEKKSKEDRREALKEAREKSNANFKTADRNGDGGLTREELAQATQKLPLIEKNFDAMDADKDGKVTIAERDGWVKAKTAEKKKKE